MRLQRNSHNTVPLRAGLYERVSSEEQVQGYSLDAQDRAGRGYCDAHGWTVVRVYRDEGKSARTDDFAKRPDFAQMIADAEAGLLDVIVVHKLDRFARNLRVTLETLERLDRAGAGFVSISENMDFTTPIGKVILATLAAFAQYYSDNLSWETKKGKAERKAQGLWNGVLPFGLKRSAALNGEGVLVPDPQAPPVPDPETYSGLLTAFQAAAEGKSDRDVAEALNAAGCRTTGNRGRNLFTKDTVRRMLTNRFYLGELPDGAGGWMPGAHAPLFDADLFERAQQTRVSNRSGALHVARARRTHSLSGIGVCAHCGGRLHIITNRHQRTRIHCYQRRQTDRCVQRSVLLDGIEAQIERYLATFTLPDETVRQIVALHEQAHAQQDDAERRRREITNRLERIRELYKWGDLTSEAYQSERDQLEAERATLRGSRDMAAILVQTATLLRDLAAMWRQATQEERNTLARLAFQSVEIKDDRVAAIVPTPDFAPFFVDEAAKNGRLGTNGNGTDDGAVNLRVDEAEATGFEPAISALTGLHVRPLHHASVPNWMLPRGQNACQARYLGGRPLMLPTPGRPLAAASRHRHPKLPLPPLRSSRSRDGAARAARRSARHRRPH